MALNERIALKVIERRFVVSVPVVAVVSPASSHAFCLSGGSTRRIRLADNMITLAGFAAPPYPCQFDDGRIRGKIRVPVQARISPVTRWNLPESASEISRGGCLCQGRFLFGAGLAASCRTFRGAKGATHVSRVPESGWPLLFPVSPELPARASREGSLSRFPGRGWDRGLLFLDELHHAGRQRLRLVLRRSELLLEPERQSEPTGIRR